jgi:hypothetical protein
MSLLIISHSCINAENQKNIVALRKYIPVRVAIPDWFKARMFRRVQHTIISELRDCVRAFKAVRFLKSQFILRPLALDLSRQPTTLINIEYDAWCLIFWQTLIARNRTNPAIKLVCTVKRPGRVSVALYDAQHSPVCSSRWPDKDDVLAKLHTFR